jgi:hypothetical protein
LFGGGVLDEDDDEPEPEPVVVGMASGGHLGSVR